MAGTAVKDYTNAVAAAQKALGKQGALPKPRVDPADVLEDARKTLGVVIKKISELSASSDDAEAAGAKVKAAAKQYAGVIKGNDFGLDADDPKNKKIIAEVTKTMLDALKGLEDLADHVSDQLDNIDKALEIADFA